jgi:hypothetical protein
LPEAQPMADVAARDRGQEESLEKISNKSCKSCPKKIKLK